MIYFRPMQGPGERLAALDASARREATSPKIVRLAGELRRLCGGNDRCAVSAALAAASTPRYMGMVPVDGGQYVLTDAEFVLVHGGDCVERSHALLAVFAALGLEAEPLWITPRRDEDGRPSADLDHCVVVVRIDGQWWWADSMRPHPARPSPLPWSYP